MVYWDGDHKKDLLIGLSVQQGDAEVMFFRNRETDVDPKFEPGEYLKCGDPEENLSVDRRAAPTIVDWDNDSDNDLVVGDFEGYISLFRNDAAANDSNEPDLQAGVPVDELRVPPDGDDLVDGRARPLLRDLNDDGKKDILTGEYGGRLWVYRNIGTDAAPEFSQDEESYYYRVYADGAPIDLEGNARSAPFVCDWTGDGHLDVLIGADDGKVRLYEGTPDECGNGIWEPPWEECDGSNDPCRWD